MTKGSIKRLKNIQDRLFKKEMSYEYSNNFDFDREFIKAKNKTSFIGQLCQLVGAILFFFGIIFTILFISGEFESNATLLNYIRNSFILALAGLFFISMGSMVTNIKRQTSLIALQTWSNAPID